MHVTDIDIEKVYYLLIAQCSRGKCRLVHYYYYYYYMLQIDAQKIELLLKQWLLEQDNMSIMHSIYDLRKKV